MEKEPEIQVFKVQRSQFDSEGRDMLLIYNEDRSIHHQQEIEEEEKESFDRLFADAVEPKIFVKGYVNEDNMLVLGEPAEWQDW